MKAAENTVFATVPRPVGLHGWGGTHSTREFASEPLDSDLLIGEHTLVVLYDIQSIGESLPQARLRGTVRLSS